MKQYKKSATRAPAKPTAKAKQAPAKRKATAKPDPDATNPDGLTFEEWRATATEGTSKYAGKSWTQLFTLAWQEGECPSEWNEELSSESDAA